MNDASFKTEVSKLGEFYRSHLIHNVIPFWVDNAIDEKDGAVNSCIDEKGKIINKDRFIWSQCRALWTFSALYNRVKKNREWLSIASGIYKYLEKYGRNEDGDWVYLVDEFGNIKEDATSIFTDGFAIYGLTEYYAATKDKKSIKIALDTYKRVSKKLKGKAKYLTHPLPSKQGYEFHALAMVFSYSFFQLGYFINDEKIINEGKKYAENIMNVFLQPSKKLLFEYVNTKGFNPNNPMERVIIPGHVIESMWFMIHVYKYFGEDEKISDAIQCIKWHIESGWDNKYGGIFLSIDSENNKPWWPYWDTKPWWPATEALYALLLCYELSHDHWCLEWYWKVHNYTFAKYPVKNHGEWNQKLDRKGNPIGNVVGLPVKDPFHLPRSCIMILQLLGSSK